jgi:hypothetical protein
MTRKKWQMQLIDPQGKTWELGSIGYAASTPELSYVLGQVTDYLESEDCDWAGKDFVLADVWQCILNERLHPYHNFRLVWGSVPKKELKEFSQYPNGRDIDWHLVYQSNGQIQECFSGSLPEGWWELEESERDHQLQNVL